MNWPNGRSTMRWQLNGKSAHVSRKAPPSKKHVAAIQSPIDRGTELRYKMPQVFYFY